MATLSENNLLLHNSLLPHRVSGSRHRSCPNKNCVSLRRNVKITRSSSVQSAESTSSASIPYEPTFLDDLFLSAFRKQMYNEIGFRSSKPGYEGMVEEAKVLLTSPYRHKKKRQNGAKLLGNSEPSSDSESVNATSVVRDELTSSKIATEEAAYRILHSMFPSFVLPLFKKLIAPIGGGEPASLLTALVTKATCEWLMGRCKLTEVEWANGRTVQSGVLVEKCKFLEETKCVGNCIHTCKMPTQTFMLQEMGVPLYMEPNLEDFSCTFKFGVMPPPRSEDKIFSSPCLSICPLASQVAQNNKSPSPTTNSCISASV